jgi:DNA-binding NtrC family response regulator
MMVLHVEDDATHAAVVARLLAALHPRPEIRHVASGNEAVRLASTISPALVLLDYRLPDTDGLTVLTSLRKMHPTVPVILLTVVASPRLVVTALHAGAADFVVKDHALADALPDAIRRVLAAWGPPPPGPPRAAPERRASLLAPTEPPPAAGDPLAALVGPSRAMAEVRAAVRIAAHGAVPVLIEGETGTGKELVARAIHALGPRRDRPFVPVNCAAVPEALAESEFFGHARGAFTGAYREKDGLFEAARGGTLFLDEIEDLPAPIQAKLLRVLQDFEYRPVGSTASRRADVRIIAASNQSARRLVEERRLRPDLYYRLRVLSIVVPPLRARRDDLPVLVTHFVERFATAHDVDLGLPPAAFLRRLCAAAWPGNVRELENTLESLCAAAHARGVRLDAVIAALPQGTISTTPLDDRTVLLHTLEAHQWSRQAAARALGISRVTLWRRMVRAGITPATGG